MREVNKEDCGSKPLLGDAHERLIAEFVHKYDRVWMHKPFSAYGKTIATDGTALVAIPIESGFEDLSEKVKHFYPFEKGAAKTIELNELRTKIESFPKEPILSDEPCEACDGDGEVEFEFDHNCKCYKETHDCPVCRGTGQNAEKIKPIGEKYTTESVFKIGGKSFYAGILNKVIIACDILNYSGEITYSHCVFGAFGLVVFNLGDIEIGLMPLRTDCGDYEVLQSIT